MADQSFPSEPEPAAPAEPEGGAAPQQADTRPEPDEPGFGPSESRGAQAREWLSQLQQMIDRIAADAAPVAREVAAKAAELAAVAGEKAGPFAKRAAEVTGDVGVRVAERSRRLADDLRHRANGGSPSGDDEAAESSAADASADDASATDAAGDHEA